MFGRLFQQVRKLRGLAYGAYAYCEFFKQAGWSKLPANGIVRTDQYFHMWTYPKEENFEFCIKLMVDEMTRVASGDLPAERIELVRDNVANRLPFLIETPGQHLGMILDQRWYGADGFIESYQSSATAVTADQVRAAAEEYLRPGDLIIVAIVSDAEQARLELLSKATVLTLPSGVDEGNLKPENERIKAVDLGLHPDNISTVKAEELFL
jgi:predicted Zn-dependent peptidase